MIAEAARRPGRNEPCHCGSGKKYKHCCLSSDEEAEREALAQKAAAATPSAAAEEGAPQPAPPPPRATSQPWKRNAASFGGTRRVTTPRKAG
jgi:hypothetical protein